MADLLDDRPSDDQEAARIRIELEKVQKGRPLSDIDPRLEEDTRMYVLGLAPNASRISIRFWEVGTLGLFARRLAEQPMISRWSHGPGRRPRRPTAWSWPRHRTVRAARPRWMTP